MTMRGTSSNRGGFRTPTTRPVGPGDPTYGGFETARQYAPSRGPPLPPSPLAQVVEVPPFERARLPWTTLLFALLGALVASLLVALAFLRIHQDAFLIGGIAAVVAGARALGLAVGATAADRVAADWPRVARWALGLAIAGVVPGLELLPMGFQAFPNWVVVCLPWLAAGAVRDGLIGAISGYSLLQERTLVWARCMGVAAVWGAYAACDLTLSGPLAEIPGGTERVQFVLALALGGCLLPAALSLSLWLAWRRALPEGTVEGE
jgi:hypothetical protein